MILPQEFFDNSGKAIEDLPEVPEITDLSRAINAGEIDLSELEKEDVQPPQNTIAGAPPVIVKPTEESGTVDNESKPPGPTKEDTQRLENVESMIMSLEGQIKKLSDSIGASEANIQQTKSDAIDELLKAPVDEKDESTVQIVSPNALPKVATTPEQQTVIGEIEFNRERLTELIQQKELLIQERNNILKPSNYFNNTELQQQAGTSPDNLTNISNQSFNSETVEGSKKVNNLFENINNVLNDTTSTEIASTVIPPVTETPEIPASLQPVTETINNITSVGDNTSTQNTTNESKSNFSQNLINKQDTALNTENINNQNFSNINNAFESATTVNQEKETFESFLPPGNNSASPTPTAENEMGSVAKDIVGILQGIREGFAKLNENLGSNFSNLNQSMQGLKSSVVNNSYNNFQGGGSNMSQEKSNNTQQRTIMPDYRGDYPQSTDFPPGFDLSKLGGTNLPNPQSIL